jgi:hypothetical protein
LHWPLLQSGTSAKYKKKKAKEQKLDGISDYIQLHRSKSPDIRLDDFSSVDSWSVPFSQQADQGHRCSYLTFVGDPQLRLRRICRIRHNYAAQLSQQYRKSRDAIYFAQRLIYDGSKQKGK